MPQIIFLIPASAYLFHQQSGGWLPQPDDTESVAAFTTILGANYLFCKVPPIEAARWAWVFWATPWFAEHVTGEQAGSE